jgi:hypothetical protein
MVSLNKGCHSFLLIIPVVTIEIPVIINPMKRSTGKLENVRGRK